MPLLLLLSRTLHKSRKGAVSKGGEMSMLDHQRSEGHGPILFRPCTTTQFSLLTGYYHAYLMLLDQDESPNSLVAEILGSGSHGFSMPRLMTCRGPMLPEEHFHPFSCSFIEHAGWKKS